MKKITHFFLLACLLCMTSTCKKETEKLTATKTQANASARRIGGGATVTSIACGVPIGTTKNIQVDFGAAGDGVTDDSKAFLKAADWINANWSSSATLELYIPTGVYRVGVQLAPGASLSYGTGTITNPPTGPTRQGFDMLALNSVQNVYIHGDPGLASQIKYKGGLFFGGMTAPGSPCNYATGCNTCGTANKYATVGNFITLTNCQCITIDELSIDGNAQSCQLMGNYGECNGYELSYDAIDIVNGSDITVSNTDCINFGRDGLMMRYTTANPTNITLTNMNCNSNCRQGFSFLAGDNVVVTNCEFNNTGSIFVNNPGSGIDIEPDIGASCVNSTFTACQFKDNAFCGMISDGHAPYVSNIMFDTCEFKASVPGSWSLFPNGVSALFYRCIITGQMTHVTGISSSAGIVFNTCFITDYDNSFSNPVSGWNRSLLNFGASMPTNHYYGFLGCTFDIHHSLLIASVNSGGASHTERDWEGNKFIFNYADLMSTVSYYGTSLEGVGYISGVFTHPSLGNIINGYLVGNSFTETAPTITYPGSYSWYWVGICTSYGAIYDNTSVGGNCFPQDGVGANPWTRVCYNNAWPGGSGWLRGCF